MDCLLLVSVVVALWTAESAVLLKEASDPCQNFGLAFDRVFAVPGEACVLECPLDIQYLPVPVDTPYNVSWFHSETGSEVKEVDEGPFFVKDNALTPDECFKQATLLIVSEMDSETCVRPQREVQRINAHVNDLLACPLRRHLSSVQSPIIQWYKNCELIVEDEKFSPNKDFLLIHRVEAQDAGFYTCRMSFSVDGFEGEMRESIECEVLDENLLKPQVIEPVNEIIEANRGSSLTKNCRVVVWGSGVPMLEVLWKVQVEDQEEFISQNLSHRIHQKPRNDSVTADGFMFVRTLFISDVLKEDLNTNYTCMVSSSRGHPTGYFTLVPPGPNLPLISGLSLSSLALLFSLAVYLCSIFKVEISLWLRATFPILYKSTAGDGKLYDAYVAYPRLLEGSSEKAEVFAMSTLPLLLESRYGYKLFILGRDGLPGEDSMGRCRRLLLLYSSSSLLSPEAQEWAEQQAGLHRALLEENVEDKAFSIILLEMEKIRDPLRLPPSVRLLRDKQGALQAWKRRRRWWCREKEEDEGDTLNPSDRFWRELRYHMPIRGKASERSWFRL
ncbi:hypothetical protein DNTS_028316 [Danionella cerebrum]|uniref:Ig-like domain-containing protein n=1 Tax=Danionella cerebrum TaxID=2873325 RepID=A0A553NL85_9TELE|nr:hypothetical protein DNTS_028316 [Danionella translucida]